MSEYICRPISDDKAQWTSTPVGPAFSVLNEVVTEVDTPDTSNNFITSSTINQINRQFMSTPTIPADEIILGIEAWWYIETQAGASATCDLLLPGSSGVVVGASFAWGWVSRSYIPLPVPSSGSSDPTQFASTFRQQVTMGANAQVRVAAQFTRFRTSTLRHPQRMPMGV